MAGDTLLGGEQENSGEAGFFQGFQVADSTEWPSGEHPLERNPIWKMANDERENGNNFVKEANYEKAIGKYSQLIMQLRSVENTSEIKWDDASRLEVRQLRAAAYLNLSLCFLKTSQWMHASNTATRALQGDKEPPDARDNVLAPDKKAKALFRRATAQCEFGNFDKANEDLKKAAELAPNDTGIQQMLRKCDYAVNKVTKKADKKMSGFLKKAQKEGDGGLFDDDLRKYEKSVPDKPAPDLVKWQEGLWIQPPDKNQQPTSATETEEEPVDYDVLASEIALIRDEKPEQYKEIQAEIKKLLEGDANAEEEEAVAAKVHALATEASADMAGEPAKEEAIVEPAKEEATGA